MHSSLLHVILFLLSVYCIASSNALSTPGDECHCTPSCMPSMGHDECPEGRLVPREDCPCCKVCLRLEGEPCDRVNNPCDQGQHGLTCSEEGICAALPRCDSDSDCPDDRFCVRNVCADPCSLLPPCPGHLQGGHCIARAHESRCECPKGTVPDHQAKICLPLQGCNSASLNLTVGEHVYANECAQKCVCTEENKIVCQPLHCPHGLFPAGSSKKDSLCIELKNKDNADECCVVLACAHNTLENPEPQAKGRSIDLNSLSSNKEDSEIGDSQYKQRLKELEAVLNGKAEKLDGDNLLHDNLSDSFGKESVGENPQHLDEVRQNEEENLQESENMGFGSHVEDNNDPSRSEPINKVIEDRIDIFPTTIHPDHEVLDEINLNEMIEQTTTGIAEETTLESIVESNLDVSEDQPLSVEDLEPQDNPDNVQGQQESFQLMSENSTEFAPTEEVISSVMITSVGPHEMILEASTQIPGAEEQTERPLEQDFEMEDGIIMEVADDGMPLQHAPPPQESEDTFRESKATPVFNDDSMVTLDFPDNDFESTHPEKFPTKAAAIQILTTTHNSTTLLLPSDSGGILHYKESRPELESSRMTIKKGQREVVLDKLSPNTRYTIKWTGRDAKSTKREIVTDDGCRHNAISYAVGATWHQGCETTCSCSPGGTADCRARCVYLAGSIQDAQCHERPSPLDPECCVEYICEKGDNNVLDSSLPDSESSTLSDDPAVQAKLIVTSRTHNSITVAWDDFRAGKLNEGYVTEYREVPTVKLDINLPWMKKYTPKDQPSPTITLDSLKPNTLYEVRVGIYSSNDDRRPIATTETITVRTEAGCVYGNTSFGTGEFFQGCEERCTCAIDGSVRCSERCNIPYFKVGSFSHDPLCIEDQADGDECCVLVMCAHGDSRSGNEDYDQCANTVCGANAECVSWPTLSQASVPHDASQPGTCKCKDGFNGDPYNLKEGCMPDLTQVSSNNTCTHRLKTYNQGEVFNQGCAFKCTCNNQEIECQARCEYFEGNIDVEDDCTFEDDPEDSCCKIKVCKEDSVQQPPSPLLDFDGCIYRNQSYAKDEQFTFGCEQRCLCMGFGDVSCSPRCPPVKETMEDTDAMCETLVDPSDECCNITICGNTTAGTDVMKLSMTGEDDEIMDKNLTMAEMEEKNVMSDMMEEMPMVTTENAIEEEMMSGKNTTDDMMQEGHKMMQEEDKMMQEMSSGNVETTTMADDVTTPSLMMDKDDDAPVNETDDVLEKSFRTADLLHEINQLEIINLNVVNSDTIEIVVYASDDIIHQLLSSSGQDLMVSYSPDSLVWSNMTIPIEDVNIQNMNDLRFKVPGLDTHNAYQFRVYYDGISSPTAKASLHTESRTAGIDRMETLPMEGFHGEEQMCEFKGKFYKQDETFYDGCEQYCKCNETLQLMCASIKCPRSFGLDLLDPGCIEWHKAEKEERVPPRCCGGKPRCKTRIEDLNCHYEGHTFIHLDVLPQEVAGCDQHCQCINAHIECENICNPVHAMPPFDLPCHPNEARIIAQPTYPCCREWQCSNDTIDSVFPGFPGPLLPTGPVFVQPIGPTMKEIGLPHIQDITEDSAKIVFAIPNEFVGLPGGIFLRFTQDARFELNPLHWENEVIHEDGMTLVDSDWEYVKGNLKPGMNYTMQLVLASHLSKTEIVSPPFVVSTKMEAPLPRLDLDAHLDVSDIKNTSARISWKQFDTLELQYIDGVRVRYWHGTKKFPMEGPMLYRESDNMILTDLYPNTKYTVDLFFIPQKGLTTTISNTKNITFTTLPKPKDKYAFELTITPGDVTKKGAKIMYAGFPEPEGKFINIYRIVYTSDGDLHNSHKSKMPNNKKEGYIMLEDLKPGVEYEVWLEAYLTNGAKRKSNVITIKTPPGDLPKPEKSETSELNELRSSGSKSYYSALVGVAILATVACIAFLLLLALYVRRQNQAKAHISSSKSAYDNPSYKTSENPNYAIELNGLKNNTNGNSRTEEP